MVALFTPGLLPALVRTMIKSTNKDVFAAIQTFLMAIPPSEATLLNNPWFRSQRARVVLREAQRDPEVIAQECMRPLRGWTLHLPAPTMPCKIWHGDADPEIHWHAAQALSKALGGVPMNLVPGAGHHLIWCHWQSILQDLKAMQTTGKAEKTIQRMRA